MLDTHALLWWKAGGDRLSANAARQIARADTMLVSPVSCWEVAMLVGKGRIGLDREVAQWVRDLFDDPATDVAELSPVAATQAGELDGFGGDPADRMLCATAAELAIPLVTKDRRVRAWARESKLIRTVW
jgi:PIN domain nuclease of toxin-antitoxin system